MKVKNVLFVVGDIDVIKLPLWYYPTDEILNTSISKEAQKRKLRIIGTKEHSRCGSAVATLALCEKEV